MLADLDGNVVPERQTLLNVVGNVNRDLNEESNSQPANHGIPPEETSTVWQQDPYRQVLWDDVACAQQVQCHTPRSEQLMKTGLTYLCDSCLMQTSNNCVA